MHFEVPKLPHSIREFFAHYVMIVVSILTALGLEAAVQHFHQAHAAEAAQQSMEAELRANLDALRQSNVDNFKRLKPLEELTALLVKDFGDGVPDAQIRQQIAERVKAGLELGLFYPRLRHEAWDVAVANQSASYLAPDVLRRLSIAYTAQREINMANLTPFLNVPAFVDAMTDARIGAADPRAFLHAVRQAATTVRDATQKLAQLERDLAQALPAEAGTPGHAASTAAAGASAASH